MPDSAPPKFCGFATRNWFLVGMAAAVALAAAWPELGARGGWLRTEWTALAGVWAIFWLQGLTLGGGALARGWRPARLQAFVLAWSFGAYPLLAAALVWAARAAGMPAEVAPGVLYLAVLPTTVASAVACTAAAGGSVPAALFATAASNLLGVLTVPALCLALGLAVTEAETGGLGGLLGPLAGLILLPLAVGQGFRLAAPALARRLKPWARLASQGLVLLMVHAAFANAVRDGVWAGVGPAALAWAGGAALFLLAAATVLVWVSSGWLRVDAPLRRTAFFCASQKSLATGLPMAAAIFGQGPALALLILPLLLFHPAQLVLSAVVAARWRPPG